MDYIVEQTQDHMRLLNIECPPLGGDTRHIESSKYSFIDYDVLSDVDDEPMDRKRPLHLTCCDISE